MNGRPLRHLVGPMVGILSPLFLYIGLKLYPGQDTHYHLHIEHFYVVSFVALLAAAVAIVVGISGSRLRNIQVIFLSMAFTSLAMVFALHGLSTPGVLLPVTPTPVPPIAAQLSVVLTAFWLWMSVLPSDHRFVARLSRVQHLLVPMWSALLALFVVGAMARPDLVTWMPLNIAPLKWVVAAFTTTLALRAAYCYWQSYRYSRFPLQIALVYGAGWLAVAQIIMSTGELWRASWWLYHFLLLGGIVGMVVGLLRQYGLRASLELVVAGLPTSSLETRLQAALGPSVRSLITATEARDYYTAGHNYRTALYALRLAQGMGLPQEALRALAQGGIIHDVGKIEVPDEVLNKPGKLTAEERALVEQHPVTGFEMCKRLGFMKEELDIIRSHHERWDGTGYPDGLKGEAIPFLARILAVADVYDALTSERAYRRAWSHEEAQRYIVEHAGRQFDPACVAAWVRLPSNALYAQEPKHAHHATGVSSSLEANPSS